MKTIAIIPAYNEESTIGDVIKATARFVDEILVGLSSAVTRKP
ncbi:MAG: hypothetical protein WA144_15935 [Candidatus Methanoperedens sp.]